MKPSRSIVAVASASLALLVLPGEARGEGEGAQITIYNQDFALVRIVRSLRVKEGESEARVSGVTAALEPDSVVLRDRQDPKGLRILEQNYEGDPLSPGFMLRLLEGKVVAFQTQNPATGKKEIVTGRVIRSGYAAPQLESPAGGLTPIVEVEGKIQFSLPGEPLFEALGGDAILEPTLLWRLWSDRAGERDVEISYLTGGLGWQATYNAVTPEKGDSFDLVGWITLTNRSGTEFKDARVKLMAGEVSKIQPRRLRAMMDYGAKEAAPAPPPQVTEKAFDEYHLYTLPRPTTLRDRQVKQVEFCRAADVPAARLYVYDGAQMGMYAGWDEEMARSRPDYGTQSNTKVFTMLEFTNSKPSGLGIPLPRGTMKIYRTDTDGARQFVGENFLDHTPAGEKVRLYLGNAFDLVGERRQTNFRIDASKEYADESFEIRLRNHKKEAVEIRVVEHLYRWVTWKIVTSSDPYEKIDSRTIEFRVKVPPEGEKVVAYQARYSW
jgi:hypothetical protein